MYPSEKIWDRLAGKFDEHAVEFQDTHARMIAQTKKYLGADDRILDCGCATGTVAIELAGHVKEIHGIDISSKMIGGGKEENG